MSKINGNIGQLLGKAFVDRHFSKEAKEEVGRMVENLRAVFKERIQNLAWMSEETKVKAIEKLESFNKKIGYPDKWRDFSDLEIVADNQVQNIMNSRKFNFAYMINKLGKPIDKDEWFMSPQTVNAYYSSSKNEIVFPAGILQPPFYSETADAALNYGGLELLLAMNLRTVLMIKGASMMRKEIYKTGGRMKTENDLMQERKKLSTNLTVLKCLTVFL